MKRLQQDDCGFASALNAIGGKWKTLILWEVNIEPRRFGELRRLLPGISEKVLAQQLREMEADRLVRREVFPAAVQRVEYSVTEFGKNLNEAVTVLSTWARNIRQGLPRRAKDVAPIPAETETAVLG
ncbi:helix-turn-helix transcriptional regulator (plasmid) [Ensifer adhaerens]|uniref:winged helix-turn-helix transcriptional regulator n=1 Tax=Ensifer adhaerens TaxID=106592 RepID=UPI000761AE4A|nr:helix-turn-helix domain-containing protein [Ensifer adhaerens]UTV41550.1 helix-turn-helix transcriptional regulator [Ensifer adhaerens]